MMKKLYSPFFLRTAFVVLFMLTFVRGWGQIIAWDFTGGTTVPTTNLPGGTTSLSYNTAGTIGSSGCTGNGYSSNNWIVNRYLQIVAPTTGYNITTMTFNIASSGSGPKNFKIQYSSTGVGGTFSDLGTTFISPNGTPCSSISANFTSTDILDNNADTVIRLVFTGGEADGTPATGNPAAVGTFRIDDLIINGNPISSNTITTSTSISGSPFCISSSSGVSVSVPFTSSGTFTTGNVYTAQLSDATGSFPTTPITLGTLTSTANTGTIIAGTISAGTAAGTGYRIRVVSSTPAVTGSDNGANLTINNSAIITAQSTAAQTLCQNDSPANLSVTATGAAFYQWYFNSSANNTSGTSLGAGATSNTYTPSTATVGTLYYYCIVKGSCGTDAVSGVSGAINVNAAPSAPTAANIVVTQNCGNTVLTYTGTVPAGETYYWQTSATGQSTANLSSTGYTIPSNNTYYLRSSNGSCWSAATSKTATIILAPTISSQPASTSVVAGNAAVFSATTSGGTVASYKWQIDKNTGTFVDAVVADGTASVSGSTYTFTTIASTTLAMSGYKYQIVFTPSSPCTVLTSSPATLTVTAAPVAKLYELVTSATQLVVGKKYIITNAKNTGSSDLSAFAISSQNSGSYRNQTNVTITNVNKISALPAASSTDTGVYEFTLGGNTAAWTLVDAANSNKFLNAVSAGGTSNYLNVVATNNDKGLWTISIDVSSYEASIYATAYTTRHKIFKNSSSTRFSCYTSGQNPVYLYVESSCISPPADPEGSIAATPTSPACGSTTLSYIGTDKNNAYWVSSTTGTETTEPATSDKTVNASGTYYIRIKNGECWSTGTKDITVVVTNAINITTQPADATVTNNATATFSVLATGGGIAYQWQVSTDCGLTWNDISGAISDSYAVTSTNSLYANGNRFRVNLSNACTSTMTSNVATLFTVVSANAVDTNFSSAEGWTNQGYSNWTQSIEGITWAGTNIALSTSNGLQFNYDTDSSVEFSLVDNPVSITFIGKLNTSSDTAANNTVYLQYYDGATWQTLGSVGYITNSNASKTIDLSSITNLTNVKFRFYRAYVLTSLRALYINSVIVSKKVMTDYTWTGGNNTTNWTDFCNWSPKGIPGQNDNVIFTNTTTAANTLIITDSRTVNNITMQNTGQFNMSAAGTFTINGTTNYDTSSAATATLDCASTMNFASTSDVTIPPFNYGNLNATGGNRTFLASKTVGICKAFTPGSGTYTVNNNSTVNYNGGNQTIQPEINYYNITFSGSGTKTPTSAINVDTNGTITITGTAIADFTNYNLGSSSNTTKLTMDGGRLIVGTTTPSATKPNMQGDYKLSGGIIEFKGRNAMTQTIRNKQYVNANNTGYQNIEITGTNVGNSSGIIGLNTNGTFIVKAGAIYTSSSPTAPIKGFDNTSTLTVENTGLFKTDIPLGFYGSLLGTNYPSVSDNVSVSLIDGSTVEYSRAGAQTITDFKPLASDESNLATGGYYNLKISGDNGNLETGTAKTISATTPIYVRNKVDVEASARLIIDAEKALIVRYAVNNNSGAPTGFIVESDGNLKQLENVTNSTSISVRRLLTLSGIGRKEYNFFSSPVADQNMKLIYGGVPANVRYVTVLNEATNLFVNAIAADWGIKARGFAVTEPKMSYLDTPTESLFKNEVEYKGIPNNGNTISINLRQTSTSKGYNVVGNPYPSNIDIVKLWKNSVTDWENNLTPEVSAEFRFWDNKANSTYVQMGGTYQGYSYAIYNAKSQSSTAAPGLDPNNGGGSSGIIIPPSNIIKVSQAFMVRASQDNVPLKFNNEMREVAQGTSYYGKDASIDRYRLQLRTSGDFVLQNAVTYIPVGNTSFGVEDTRIPNSQASDALFSYAGEAKVVINGRNTFNTSDVISLGVRHFEMGTYKIEAVDMEGVFANGQSIYLKDKQLNILTDLTAGSYTFTSDSGEFTHRFEIVYVPGAVLTTESSTRSSFEVFRDANDFVVRTSDEIITKVEVYDAAGRMVMMIPGTTKEVRIDSNRLVEGLYIIKANLRNGEMYTKKIRK